MSLSPLPNGARGMRGDRQRTGPARESLGILAGGMVSPARVALVTGATGFVGGHLVRRLLVDGWETHAIVRPSSNATTLRDVLGSSNVHEHDGSTSGLINIVGSVHPLAVFHLASAVITDYVAVAIEPLIRSNILFGTQLLEAMAVA